ncbi:MAG: hypothetical protein MEQ84_09215 [Mesorhizobium sp.]|nr:hypothetical protein [Mesorhizobium sp.]
MKRLVAAALLLTLAAGPALATGSIGCEGTGGDEVSVDLTIGSLPVLAVVSASIAAGDDVWSMDESSSNRIAVGQAFSEDGRILVDFVDPNFETVLVRLRLVSAGEGKDEALAGTLAISGRGAWPVICVGP